jgi:hypothetical protein
MLTAAADGALIVQVPGETFHQGYSTRDPCILNVPPPSFLFRQRDSLDSGAGRTPAVRIPVIA